MFCSVVHNHPAICVHCPGIFDLWPVVHFLRRYLCECEILLLLVSGIFSPKQNVLYPSLRSAAAGQAEAS